MLTVKNKSDTLQETFERDVPNDENENFVIVDIEAEAGCIPTISRVKWSVRWESQVKNENPPKKHS